MITPIRQEQLADGLLYQVFPPVIHSLTFFDTDRQTIDLAYTLVNDLNQSRANEHLQILYIAECLSLTPHLRSKINQLLTTIPQHRPMSVAVVADSFFAQIVERLIVSSFKSSLRSCIHICSTEQDAFEWLAKRRAMFNS